MFLVVLVINAEPNSCVYVLGIFKSASIDIKKGKGEQV